MIYDLYINRKGSVLTNGPPYEYKSCFRLIIYIDINFIIVFNENAKL